MLQRWLGKQRILRSQCQYPLSSSKWVGESLEDLFFRTHLYKLCNNELIISTVLPQRQSLSGALRLAGMMIGNQHIRYGRFLWSHKRPTKVWNLACFHTTFLLNIHLRVELLGHVEILFTFEEPQNIFHSNYIILHFHQHCTRVPISYSSQILFSFFFFFWQWLSMGVK